MAIGKPKPLARTAGTVQSASSVGGQRSKGQKSMAEMMQTKATYGAGRKKKGNV